MVDIHVIPNPGFEENLITTIRALQHERTRVQVADYVSGNVLEARWQAYQRGTCPYVSWVDGDDRVLSIDWIETAIDILDAYPHVAAVYPRWTVVKKGKLVKTTPIHVWNSDVHAQWSYLPLAHHLTVMRRHQVLELLNDARKATGGMLKSQDRYLMSGLVRYGVLVSLDDIAYEWHLHEGTARSAQDSPEAVKFCRQRAAEDLKLAAEVHSRSPWRSSTRS